MDFLTFSSASVKPRPSLTRRLCLMVGHRTTGRSLSTGRGATAAALERRASLRRDFEPGCTKESDKTNDFPSARPHSAISAGEDVRARMFRTWSKWVRTRRCQSFRRSILSSVFVASQRMEGWDGKYLTVADELLVVPDRL